MAESPENEHPRKAFGWAARDASGCVSPFHFSRRATGENDVRLKVLYCGICHSDLNHVTLGDDGYFSADYPVVPGHEIVGEVTEVGSNVQDFEVGDKIGVSGMIGSCGSCDHCSNDLENFCRRMIPITGGTYYDGTKTYGGFSDSMVVDEHFAVRIPDNVALDAIAPLLCAGITVYSPMKYFQLNKPGLHIGVVRLGALGHMAVKFAKAFGAKVTVISNSSKDKDEAINHLGADFFLVFHKPKHMQAAMETMDGIIDAVPVAHSLSPLVDLLKARGKLIMLFCPDPPLELPLSSLTRGSKVIAGNRCIGGIKEMQEMINFAAEHDMKADVEVIPMDYINRAMDRLDREDVKYCFVIDIGNTLKSTSKNSSDEESDEEPPDQPCNFLEEEPLVERTKKVGHRKKNRKEKSSQKLSMPSSVKSNEEKMRSNRSTMKRKKHKFPSVDPAKQKRPKFRAPTRRTWLN